MQVPNVAKETEKYTKAVSQRRRKIMKKRVWSNAVLFLRVKVLLLIYFFQRNGHTNWPKHHTQRRNWYCKCFACSEL